MDSASKTGLTLLAFGSVAVLALMVRLRGHMSYELALGGFLTLQVLNAVLILRGTRRS